STSAPTSEGTAIVHAEFQGLCLDDSKGKELVFFLHLLDSSFICQKGIIALDDKDNGMKSM
ncbi:hypothetical protein DBR06_SOUSAS17310003, partial [Sousa chinensis]